MQHTIFTSFSLYYYPKNASKFVIFFFVVFIWWRWYIFHLLMEATVALTSQECESSNTIKRTRNSINKNHEVTHNSGMWFTLPMKKKKKLLKLAQESTRKDVERAFVVIKKKWHYIKHPIRAHDGGKINNVLVACVILHNMELKDKGRAICMYNPNDVLHPPPQI